MKVTKSHFIMMVSIKNISQKSFLLLLMVFSAMIFDTEAYNIHSYSKKCRVGLSEAQKACSVCKWYNISRESLPMRIQHVCFHLHKNQCCSQIKNQYLNWLYYNSCQIHYNRSCATCRFWQVACNRLKQLYHNTQCSLFYFDRTHSNVASPVWTAIILNYPILYYSFLISCL